MEKGLRLNCRRCASFTHAVRRRDDPDSVVRCDGCGKKHSTDSLHFVDVDKTFDRDESGALIEEVPI